MGDVHGQLDKLLGHLRAARLIDDDYDWLGETARLWFVGDYFDRGPHGIDVINLIRHLQIDATPEGGEVGALVGNHDVLILSARRFLENQAYGAGFIDEWLANGGETEDLQRLTDDHVTWLSGLPAMASIGDTLLAHADSEFYLGYGPDVGSINHAICRVLRQGDPFEWDKLLRLFSDRHAFDGTTPGGERRASDFLETFQTRRLIHGHTPIDKVTHQDPEDVHEALAYADGLCVNVDGGMYRGGPGFLYRADEEVVSHQSSVISSR
jgi:Calcineurin-like phosphoesterase